MASGHNEMLFTRGVGKYGDSDIWDDTALIKAYDKAVASFKNALKDEEEDVESPKEDKPGKKRKSNKKNKSRKRSNAIPEKEWRVGDTCCAFWSVDGHLYSAKIASINHNKGTCTVVYANYGNKEQQNLADLLSENSDMEEDGARKVTQVKADESSTEESDKSLTPQMPSHKLPSHQHRPKPRPRPPSGPSKWGSGCPPTPPQGPSFRTPESRSGGPGATFRGQPPVMSFGPPIMPPPPPPPLSQDSLEEDDALGCMLISWYMSGYHTGYYLGLKQAREEAASGKRSDPR
ncbi:hypothetical protein AAFF_G00086320 [Aldrovandia affinis]|uniref:Tudor domain-containing protein n=1 Tax=Aldrovandia affinis TaxID=143900 RepID=A0AAD7RWR0_9TELE|nr:hypothetical protein AAFF_G00086320 [Aldrovandia affinis]